MTLSTTTSRVTYSGSGTTGPFAFTFKIFIGDDLLVTKRSVAGAETTLTNINDYSVTGVGNATGGSVTLVLALAVGETLTIRRVPHVTQDTSIRNQGAYFPATIEDEFDKLVMIDQAQQDQINRSLRLSESNDPSAFAMTLPAPTAGSVLTGTGTGFTMAPIVTANGVVLPGNGRTVSTLSAYLANQGNTRFNVKDYGAIGDGVADDTVAIQLAIDTAKVPHGIVEFPSGTYKVTNGLLIYNGTQLKGETGYQLDAGNAIDPKATRINFVPTSQKDLFTATGSNRFHISMEGFFIFGNSVSGGGTFSRYGLNLDGVWYARFENMGIDGFQYAIRCNATINNRFVNLMCTGTVACVLYAGGIETTDVWDQCTFYGSPSGVGSPIGVQFLGISIAIRFQDCLWEQINNYGMDIAKECQNIMVVNGYCEDVPFLGATSNSVMFRVGYSGAALVIENHLTVIGGKWTGRNPANGGTIGNFLDCDFSNGVMLVDVNVSRFTNVIRTTGNTRNNSVVVTGAQGIGWALFATDFSKVVGLYPTAVINAGGQTSDMRLGSVTATALLVAGGGFGCNGAAAQTAAPSGGPAPSGGVGTAAGGWDTAAHRDAAITLLNNIRSALVANGIMS